VNAADLSARRVLFLADELHSSGGLELFELAIAEALSKRGWELVLSYATDGDLVDRWSAIAEMRRRDAHPDLAAAVSRSDIVYCHWVHLLEPALAAAQSVGRPVAGHLHLPPFHLRDGWKGLVKGRHRWPMEPRVWSKRTEVGAFAAVSDFTRAQWLRSGLPADRVLTIHNGIDLAIYRPPTADERREVRAEFGVSDDEIVIGYVGRLDPLKGVHHLLDAFSTLAAGDPRLRLVIVGAPTRNDIAAGERFADELRARSPATVRWLGKRRDTERLYRGFDLFVVPSNWDEPFGLVTIEAMASGVPVLSTCRGGIPEILTGPLARWLVEPDTASIREGLERLLAEDLAAVGRSGLEHVRSHFTIDHTAAGVERMLLDLISGGGRARPELP